MEEIWIVVALMHPDSVWFVMQYLLYISVFKWQQHPSSRDATPPAVCTYNDNSEILKTRVANKDISLLNISYCIA